MKLYDQKGTVAFDTDEIKELLYQNTDIKSLNIAVSLAIDLIDALEKQILNLKSKLKEVEHGE